jgi:hypothetical protein
MALVPPVGRVEFRIRKNAMPEDTESGSNKQDNAPDEGFRPVGPHFTPLLRHRSSRRIGSGGLSIAESDP